MSPSYPELATDFERISAVAHAEEEAFLAHPRAPARSIFDTAVAETKEAGSTLLAGDQAFQLHDTYGFPIDLTLEMAAEAGPAASTSDGFRRLMAEQRDRAKADAAARKTGHADLRRTGPCWTPGRHASSPATPSCAAEATVVGLLVDGGRRCRPPARATRSSWCSTAPRSTPRAAASRPTPASSAATASRSEVDDVQ